VSELLGELLAYVALDAGDRARLVTLHAVLAPELPAIADAFVAAAQANATTAATLSDPERITRLRASLISWMSTGLLGPHDDGFVAKRARIGRRHVELGLAQHYLIAAMSVVRGAYHDRIALAYAPAEALAVGRAVHKLLDLELALMLRTTRADSDEELVAGERRRRLEQVEAMQTLCAGLAHEVRNPLNSAKLQLELAARRLRRGGDDPRLVEPVELAGHELDRLTVLLDEFLAFARPPALDPHPQDIVSVVRDVIEHDRPLAERRGAALTLVDGTGPIVVEIDAVKVHQIVDSLVCNAIEAVAAGGHITIAIVPAAAHIHIRVTDDGPGIPAEVLPRIYEPFFSTKEGGTGMGMSIVHSLVALHRGTIEVTSSRSGTTFDVAVPRRSPA
jgi:signal transduction histidine kinase